ncbi:predicted protein [Nematostella vectensis]|uniref:G-protein coupled receptors family 1 profile domain-containing protein n=1 Tax=Nematostella vectensis TaxID=45351 RepID=A7SAD6_NEMVE|nr:predicted protein [Nematostella vectensis]|eukprot:XP_001631417.1 predicted protein [Nematostella vectensis]
MYTINWSNATNVSFSISNATDVSRSLSVKSTVVLVTYFILVIFGVALNMTVILLVWTRKVPRKNMHLFVTNMAMADLLSLTTFPIYTIVQILQYAAGKSPPLNDDSVWKIILCKLLFFISNSALTVSPITLLVISVERLRAVSATVQLTPLSRRTLVALIAFSWIASGGLMAGSAIESTMRQTASHQYYCGADLTDKSFIIYSLSICFVPVLLVLAITSTNIGIIQKLTRPQAEVSLPEAVKQRRTKTFRSIVRMVLSSTLLYAICVAPGYIAYAVHYYYFLEIHFVKGTSVTLEDWISSSKVTSIIFPISYVNAAFGPILYFVFLEDFRTALRKLLCRRTTVEAELKIFRKNIVWGINFRIKINSRSKSPGKPAIVELKPPA